MQPINGNELPSRPELRKFGYAPGNYMGTCRKGNHTVHNIDKRATCCLACAEQLLKEEKVMIDRETPPGLEDPKEDCTAPPCDPTAQYVGGKLTALKGTMIPLTVERVGKEGLVHTMRFVGTELRREKYDPKMLIGAGDELVFKDGVFDRAQ